MDCCIRAALRIRGLGRHGNDGRGHSSSLTFWPFIFACALVLALDFSYVHFNQTRRSLYHTWIVISKNSLHSSIFAINAFAAILVILRLVTFILFDGLRPIEYEHILDKLSVTITDTFLLLVLMRARFSKEIFIPLGVLTLSKFSRWILEDRLEYIESRLSVPLWSIVRIIFVLASTIGINIGATVYFALKIDSLVPKSDYAFLLEFFLSLISILNLTYNYFLFAYEDQIATHEDTSFNKTLYVLYGNLTAVVFSLIAQCLFFLLLVRNLMFPFISIRSFMVNLQDLRKYLKTISHSRRATQLTFADATEEELANADSTCIICREEMTIIPDNPNSCKKLPCGHILHKNCLKSWLQRQQVCPLCRAPVNPPRGSQNQQENNAQRDEIDDAPAEEAQRQQQNNEDNQPAQEANENNREAQEVHALRRRERHHRRAERAARRSNRPSRIDSTVANARIAVDVDALKQGLSALSNSITTHAPYSIPMPEIPADFSKISQSALQQLEHEMSINVRARMKHLVRIQNMINATNILMNSYESVTENIAEEQTRARNSNTLEESQISDHDATVQRILNIVDDDTISWNRNNLVPANIPNLNEQNLANTDRREGVADDLANDWEELD